jgi:hypothetical protein
MSPWVRHPDYGGVKIPKLVQERTKLRILKYAEKHYAGKYIRLDVRFRGQFCYIDAYREIHMAPGARSPVSHESREEFLERMRNTPIHLCRIRYFGKEDAWGFAFYTYSHERYELCVLDSGSFYGTPEEAFKTAAVYLES